MQNKSVIEIQCYGRYVGLPEKRQLNMRLFNKVGMTSIKDKICGTRIR